MQTWHLVQNYFKARFGASFTNRESLSSDQQAQLSKLLTGVIPHSPLYKDLFRGLKTSDWEQLPIVDRAWVATHFDRLNTVGMTVLAAEQLGTKANSPIEAIAARYKGQQQTFFLQSAEEASQELWAILSKMFPNTLLNRQRIAVLARSKPIFHETKPSDRLYLKHFDCNASLERQVKALNAFNPNVLIAPPAILRFLGEAKSAGRLLVFPEKVISISEVLDPLDKDVIQRAFDQTLHQVYLAAEGFLGHTCAYGNVHLNEDIFIIERDYINPAKRTFLPIVTHLHRKTQPILRHKLPDILTERSMQCPCGSVMMGIEQIEGRMEDVFYVRSDMHDEWMPFFPSQVRKAVVSASTAIQNFRVQQFSPFEVEVGLLVPDGMFDQVAWAVGESLKRLFAQSHVRLPLLSFSPLILDESTWGAPFRRIERLFPFEHLAQEEQIVLPTAWQPNPIQTVGSRNGTPLRNIQTGRVQP